MRGILRRLKISILNGLCAVIFFIPVLFSCNKEAQCDCVLDSVKVARIFQPDGALGKDAVIESITPDQNFGSSGFFGTFSWTTGGLFNHSRGLVSFDLTSIPSGTSIKKAYLSLYWIKYGNLTEHTGENAFSVFRINQPWDETTVTWNNQPQVSTNDSIVVSKSSSVTQTYTIDVTTYIQDMVNNPTNNHGLLLKLNEEIPYKLVVTGSSDNSDESKRPKLAVYY